MSARAINMYKRVDIDSAPKTQIVDRLFERFLRDVDDARRAIGVKDIHAKAAALDHAAAIVTELDASLDHAVAPDLCKNLSSLYHFVAAQLSTANATLTTAPLDQATRVMSDLAAAFRQVHGP